MSSKLLTSHAIYHTATPEESERRFKRAQALGYAMDQRGRAYIPWKTNVRGMRWQHGKLIPRHQK